ncbi:MAG: PHB depolymerase family esterase [Kiritimatiellia bacterium]|nr:PHB depolymerase family esterase [Kiritimatiellia bacterium]
MQSANTLKWVATILALMGVCARGQELKSGVQSLTGEMPDMGPIIPGISREFDLSKETFFISKPPNVRTSTQPGILVYLSPSDNFTEMPAGWDRVLRDRNLILIAPQNAGNKQKPARREGLAVLAASKLKAITAVDPRRIYVAGFSGGARMASSVAFRRPDLFSGVFAVCGADFPRKVTRVKAEGDEPYGYFSLEEDKLAAAKDRVKFVIVTGNKDFRYGYLLDIFTGGFEQDGYAVKLIDVRGMDHTLCSAKELSEGLSFLDGDPARGPRTR